MSDGCCTGTTHGWDDVPNLGEMDDSTLNEGFDLLRKQRRRYVLAAFQTTGNTVLLADEITDYILTHDPDADDRDRVLMELRHKTLPRLADGGIIELPTQTDTVRYHGSPLIDNLLVALTQ